MVYMICNKHPNHEQAPGVCSVCLEEKLSQLSVSSSGNIISSVSTSFSSSCYSSSEGSPVHRMGSLKHVRMSGDSSVAREELFRKSKWMAVVEREREEREVRNKKRGFWAKLLKRRTKKIESGLAHSNMITTRVH